MRAWLLLLLAGVASSVAVPPADGKDIEQQAYTNASKTKTGADPCLYLNGGCSKDAVCSTSEEGNAVCTCIPTHTGNGKNCTQISGCQPGICGANAHCVEGGKATEYTCVCDDGFENKRNPRYQRHYEHVTVQCVEIKPCDVYNGGCDSQATCVHRAPGNNTCRCNTGYTGTGKKCAEIDVCTTASHFGNCSANATCTKTGPGVAKCTCNMHYTGDGETCKLMDPCNSEHDCHADAECQNLGKGYSTCVCKDGYFGTGFQGDDGCKPINACEKFSVHQSTCHDHASCVYTGPGSHKCECNTGYTGNGVKVGGIDKTATGCAATNPCNVDFGGCDKLGATCEQLQPPVFDSQTGAMRLHKCTCKDDHLDIFNNGSKCDQINYCTNNNKVPNMPVNGGCHINANCKHLAPRQFECVCKPGFTGNGRDCDAYDMCQLNFGGCDKEGAKCIYQGPGKNTCKCKTGWSGDGKNCTQTCSITDADCEHGSRFDPQTCSCQNCNSPFMGQKCNECNTKARTCANGGQMNTATCACEQCEKPYGGETCETCTLTEADCKNGAKFNHAACMCECAGPWEGETCEKCSRIKSRSADQVCLHRGTFSEEDCACTKCPYPWTGELCSQCGRTDKDCPVGATLNQVTCKCDACPKGFGGDVCDKCIRTKRSCQGRGTINEADCKCENCANGWVGDFCETCSLKQNDCQSGYLDMATCSCKGCTSGFEDGYVCSSCSRDATECKNGGVLNRATCQCVCTPPFTGKNCNECGLNASDCMGDSKLNKTACLCSNCTVPGGNNLCSVCAMTEDMCEHGQLNKKTCTCQDAFPFTGKTGAQCGLKPADCRHGSKLDADNCRCVSADAVPSIKQAMQSCSNKLKSLVRRMMPAAQIKLECERHSWGSGKSCSYTEGVGGKHFCTECTGADSQTGACPKDWTFCPKPWSGLTCNNCMRKNSECVYGKIDPRTCECRCNSTAIWGGDSCDQCLRENYDCAQSKGGFNGTACNCGKCNSIAVPSSGGKPVVRYAGDKCQSCALSQSHCRSGTLNMAECRCVDCASNYSGLLCETCDLKVTDCSNGKLVNCKCECNDGWTGETCSKARCEQDCNGHGTCTRSGEGVTPQKAVCQCLPGFAGKACERDAGLAMSKPCYSTGMKHVTTFDQAVFDHYEGGEYLMYADIEDPFEEQIHVLQAKYARKAGMYAVAIRRNSSISHVSGMDTVTLMVPQSVSPNQGSHNNKLLVTYDCDIDDGKKSYNHRIIKAGSTGHTFPNGVTVTRTNQYQYEVRTPSGLFMMVDSYYNGDQQFINTYLSVRATEGSFAPKGYCGNFNGNKDDDDLTRPSEGGINSIVPGGGAQSYKKGMRSLFECTSDDTDPKPYAADSVTESVKASAALYQRVTAAKTSGDFAQTFADIATKSAVSGSDNVDAVEYCELHRKQMHSELEGARVAGKNVDHLTYFNSNMAYPFAWNACASVCGGRYKGDLVDFTKPKEIVCRACIIDQCNQMEAAEGGSTVGGNAARSQASVTKFVGRLTSEQSV